MGKTYEQNKLETAQDVQTVLKAFQRHHSLMEELITLHIKMGYNIIVMPEKDNRRLDETDPAYRKLAKCSSAIRSYLDKRRVLYQSAIELLQSMPTADLHSETMDSILEKAEKERPEFSRVELDRELAIEIEQIFKD